MFFGLFLLILTLLAHTGCSKTNDPAAINNTAKSLIEASRISIEPIAPGPDCTLGGFYARSWEEIGGLPDSFESQVDRLLILKKICNSTEKQWVNLKSSVEICTASGQENCFISGTFHAGRPEQLNPWNIRENATMFGVQGRANFESLMTIGAHRNRSFQAVTYAQLKFSENGISLWRLLSAGVAAGYREIPKIMIDDDGESRSENHVKAVIRGISEWNVGVPRKVCGTLPKGYLEKINDCSEQHSIKPVWDAGIASQLTWNGVSRGTTSEGSWTLVTIFASGKEDGAVCNSQCFEVWRDDRTGMLWSDSLKDGFQDSFNWCKASGVHNSSDALNPYRQDDSADICDHAANQNQSQNPKPISLCFEDPEWLDTPITTFPMKGNMHKQSNASGRVKWRLPTRADWLIAENNGFRSVLPNVRSNFWTATISSYFEIPDRSAAWFAGGVDGDIIGSTRSRLQSVRCIGAPEIIGNRATQTSSFVNSLSLEETTTVGLKIEVTDEQRGQNCEFGGLKIQLLKATSTQTDSAAINSAQFQKTYFACNISETEGVQLKYTPEQCSHDGEINCIATSNLKAYDVSSMDYRDLALGQSFAGIDGQLNVGRFLSSGLYRNPHTQGMTYFDEIYTIGTDRILRTVTEGVGFGSREIPKTATDDEGYSSSVAGETYGGGISSAAKVFRTRKNHGSYFAVSEWNPGVPRVICGKTANTLEGKISDCAMRHINRPDWDAGITGQISWDGTKRGINSEGRWTLVTVFDSSLSEGAQCNKTLGCYEVWRDDRTGMLWSDRLQTSDGMIFNWCHASGNHLGNNPQSPYRDSDPSQYCSSPSQQNQDMPLSLCHEDPDFLSTPTDADPMKGNMHLHAGASLKVKWRLPTRRDWEMAEFNGMRLVLPLTTGGSFWLATVDSTERYLGWTFSGIDGYSGVQERTDKLRVRCIGIPSTTSSRGGGQ